MKAVNDFNRTHTYASDGIYDVKITGIREGWSFFGESDAPKISATRPRRLKI
jgi:hypothetical protein